MPTVTGRVSVSQPNLSQVKPRWFNSLGEPVDLDTIDSGYAANILAMALNNRIARGWSREDLRNDPLLSKLRERIDAFVLPTLADKARAADYNRRNEEAGLPFRAPLR